MSVKQPRWAARVPQLPSDYRISWLINRNRDDDQMLPSAQPSDGSIIRLDELVVQNIALKLHFIDRLFQEEVSRYFARFLHLANNNTAVSLEISGRFTFSGRRRAYRGFGFRNRDAMSTFEPNLRNILVRIFSRFKRFRRLKIMKSKGNEAAVCKCMIDIFEEEASLCPIEMRRLDMFSETFNIKSGTLLIEKFSRLLRVLTFDLTTDGGNRLEQSRELWSAVGKCVNLRTLSYCPRKNHSFIADWMLDSIKQMPLRQFRCPEYFIDDQWLARAFAKNRSLQVLFIGNESFRPLTALHSSTIRPIVKRLRTFGVTFSRDQQKDTDNMARFRAVLRQLPEHGYPTVDQWIDDMSNLLVDKKEASIQSGKDTISAIEFWLDVSAEESRTIHLCLLFEREPTALTNQAIRRLQASAEFTGFRIEQLGKRTVLRYNDYAEVVLSIARQNELPLTVW